MIMKKTLLISILALLGMTQAVAQWDGSDYLPIVREGVKWVNEKVIINHGDTTSYYYTYEFNGKDSVGSNDMSAHLDNALYYYTGNSLDTEQDSLIAGLSDGYPYLYEVSFFRNHAYDAVKTEGRNMIELPMYTNGGTRTLYRFSGWGLIDFFLMIQEWTHEFNPEQEVFLTSENFTEVEPIEIEGHSCSRYAYVKENGDTMCYVVEGIGFDSRNMGDLLTPFTREPDPDADYQEYWGLSHVVKDGKIIYKGMRYNPALFEDPGDVNGDGEINIADANSVIDIVILGGNAGHTRAPAADSNHDGEVNIGDINTIIDIILNKK